MRIPYSRQTIEPDDVAAVSQTLLHPLITQGPAVPAFEAAFSSFVQAPHSVACSSGTAALTLAYRALGVGPQSVVWTVPNTFVATANAALYCGAHVDFVDIDPVTWNISIQALAEKLHRARKIQQLPQVVAPVHFSGLPCDMEAIAALAREFRFAVVEDAAHALGATFQGSPIGSCRWSDATTFSFHPVKTMTTGEGGMISTKSEAVASAMSLLRTHGITKEKSKLQEASPGDWYYEQQELGWHYRLTDIQAALGLSQLKKVSRFCEERAQIVQRYFPLLSGREIEIRDWQLLKNSAHHLFVVHLKSRSAKRARVFEGMRASSIGVQVHYIPVHLQPYYKKLGFRAGSYPVAEEYYAGAISLPVYPGLSETDQKFVVETFLNLLEG